MGDGVWAGGEAVERRRQGGGCRRPGQILGGGVMSARLGEGEDAPTVGGRRMVRQGGVGAAGRGSGGGGRGGEEDEASWT
jgi:hypothetical protein